MQQMRLNYIDLLKGFAIFLMVMGHALSWSYSDGVVRTPDNALVRNLIYAFHMPLFFFLSGYVIDLSGNDWNWVRCKSLIWKRVVSLGIPCITWFAITAFKGEVPWFLRALLLIVVLFVLLKYIIRNIKNKWLEAGVLLVGGYVALFTMTQLIRDTQLDQLFNMTVFQIHYPYFVIGYLYRKSEVRGSKILNSNILFTLCFIVFILLFYVYNWTEQPHVIHAGLRYLLAFSGIQLVYQFVKSINDKDNWLYHSFMRMGKHSIEIYLLSNSLILRMPDLFHRVVDNNIYPGNVVAQLLFGFLVSIPCVVFCLAITRVVSYSKLLNFILFGKK